MLLCGLEYRVTEYDINGNKGVSKKYFMSFKHPDSDNRYGTCFIPNRHMVNRNGRSVQAIEWGIKEQDMIDSCTVLGIQDPADLIGHDIRLAFDEYGQIIGIISFK